jgi:hypothetical protein
MRKWRNEAILAIKGGFLMCIKRAGRVALIALLAIIAVGCAINNRQPFDRSANRDIKTIGMLEPAFGGGYVIVTRDHFIPGNLAGIIMLAEARDRNVLPDSGEFSALIKERKFDAAKEFQSALEGELTRVGYRVKILKPQREKLDFVEDYSKLDKEVDAYLDIALGAGYYRLDIAEDYLPSVFVRLRLVRKDGKAVYKDFVTYGYQFTRFELNIDSDPAYIFKSADDLAMGPDTALEGMRKGVPLLARQIARDLAQQVQ